MPSGQLKHAVAPSPGPYDPSSHGEHPSCSDTARSFCPNWPSGHSVHSLALPVEYWPAAHSRQEPMPVEPCAGLLVPAGHAAHANCRRELWNTP